MAITVDPDNEDTTAETVVEEHEERVENADDTDTGAPSELERVRAALKKANDEAKRNRLRVKELEQSNETETEAAARSAQEKVESKYKTRLVSATANAQFVEAGLVGSPDRLIKLLDMSAVEITDDGIAGLDEQILALKTDYPELFKKSARVAGSIDAAPVAAITKPLTGAERIIAAASARKSNRV